MNNWKLRNLCDTCKNEIPTCKAKDNDVKFGEDFEIDYGDNVVMCVKYEDKHSQSA